MNGEYIAMDIEVLADRSLQGYSAALDLYLRWVDGELALCDPATDQPIATFEYERERADTAEAELAAERARVRELEERLRRRDS